jgi:phenylpropionate dioxygenase-like ring-hydroxylating dioxygenase large terminal subunit
VAFNFPHPLPNGWFHLAYADEVAPGELATVRAFGQELVLFRTASGALAVAEPFCPHLGAHLGHGGRVEGESVVCPFHAWRFGVDGACLAVPYAKRIPPKARLATWPAVERNGAVYVWRHAEGKPPCYELPELPVMSEPGWQGPRRLSWTIRAQFQEVLENVFDPAHFRYVHGTATLPESAHRFDGVRFHALNEAKMKTPRGVIDGRIEGETTGPGFGFVRYRMGGEMLHTTCSTPLDAEHVVSNFAFWVKGESPAALERGIGPAMIAEIERQMAQDIPIWENKKYLARPLLCDGDGPILKAREWMQQFYSPEPTARHE